MRIDGLDFLYTDLSSHQFSLDGTDEMSIALFDEYMHILSTIRSIKSEDDADAAVLMIKNFVEENDDVDYVIAHGLLDMVHKKVYEITGEPVDNVDYYPYIASKIGSESEYDMGDLSLDEYARKLRGMRLVADDEGAKDLDGSPDDEYFRIKHRIRLIETSEDGIDVAKLIKEYAESNLHIGHAVIFILLNMLRYKMETILGESLVYSEHFPYYVKRVSI